MKKSNKKIGIKNVTLGKRVSIVRPVNLYGCQIGDDSFVGPFVEIQKNVKVGKNCRIQSHSFLCELVSMGDNCFIGHGVMFINDLMKEGRPSRKSSDWSQTQIGNHVSIGSNATILPVKICDHVLIGAGSVVVKNITKSGIYAGNPAKFLRSVKRSPPR